MRVRISQCVLVLVGLLDATESLAQPKIASSALPSGTVSVAYSTSLSANAGKRPYVWSITAGSLPGGLALNGAGDITGSPTASGTFSFTASVKDADGLTDSKLLSITVAANVIITASSLPDGTVGV